MKTKKRAVRPRGYSAHSTQMVTDGIITQVENRFDFTKPMTKDDVAALKATLSAATPRKRIRRRLAELDALQDSTPAIQLHVDAIREIYEQLGDTEREKFNSLRKADRHWKDILILRDLVPKAVFAVPFIDHSGKTRTPSAPRTAITRVLKRFMPRNLGNLALFDEVAKILPRGWHATQSPKRLIGPRSGEGMGWPRFRTVASEERKKLGIGRKRKLAKK